MKVAPGWSFERGMVVREPGPAVDPPVLWLHGLGESGMCFERVLAEPALAGLRHLVPDLPGYGRSPWPESPPSLAGIAELVAGWLTERGEPPAVVIGHSMGGVVATMLAERHPGVVRSVVNVDGNLSPGDCTYSGQAVEHSLGDFVSKGFDRLRERVFSLGLDDAAHRGYWASLRLADPAAVHLHSRELVELSARETLAVRLAGLSRPAIYVAGSPGGACGRSRELLDAAGVTTVLVQPSGHWPFIDRPAAFAACVRSVLG